MPDETPEVRTKQRIILKFLVILSKHGMGDGKRLTKIIKTFYELAYVGGEFMAHDKQLLSEWTEFAGSIFKQNVADAFNLTYRPYQPCGNSARDAFVFWCQLNVTNSTIYSSQPTYFRTNIWEHTRFGTEHSRGRNSWWVPSIRHFKTKIGVLPWSSQLDQRKARKQVDSVRSTAALYTKLLFFSFLLTAIWKCLSNRWRICYCKYWMHLYTLHMNLSFPRFPGAIQRKVKRVGEEGAI